MSHIFISHSSKDKKYVRALETELRKRAFEVWVDDRAIGYGTHWPTEIEQAIIHCAALIVVMTPNSAHRKSWVRDEIILAKKNDKPIFPLLLSGDVFFGLAGIHYTDVTDGQMPPERFYEELREAVSSNATSNHSTNDTEARQYYERGETYIKARQYEQALVEYNTAIHLKPDYVEAYKGRGDVFLFGYKDFTKALHDYEKALKLNPKYAPAYVGRGNYYAEQGENKQAFINYTEAIRLDSNYGIAYNNRGTIYNKQGDYSQALKDFNQAILLDPNSILSYANRGFLYGKQGDYKQAIADYTQIIRLDRNNVSAYLDRGKFYFDQGNYDRALADYNEAIRLDPKNALAFNNRGATYGNQGKKEQALADYNEAIRLDPKLALAYKNRGFTYESQGDFKQAEDDFRRATLLDPGNSAYQNALKRVSKKKGKKGKRFWPF